MLWLLGVFFSLSIRLPWIGIVIVSESNKTGCSNCCCCSNCVENTHFMGLIACTNHIKVHTNPMIFVCCLSRHNLYFVACSPSKVDFISISKASSSSSTNDRDKSVPYQLKTASVPHVLWYITGSIERYLYYTWDCERSNSIKKINNKNTKQNSRCQPLFASSFVIIWLELGMVQEAIFCHWANVRCFCFVCVHLFHLKEHVYIEVALYTRNI